MALTLCAAGAVRAGAAPPAPSDAPMTSACIQDDQVATPKGYAGWDRSSVVAWEAIEQYGGVVPDIDEDRSHAPPAWWRYPSARRSARLLSVEAADAGGLYSVVPPDELKQGDILVRAAGAGACGKMAIVVGQISGRWMTLEAEGEGTGTRSSDPLLFDGEHLRPEAAAYRIRVKKDETLGHVRELRRDLEHLERTVGERPPLLAKNGRAAVDEKVHDLLDEAWSLTADVAFDLDRRALAGRALALGAALDWPGARAAGAALLDDVLRKAPLRADAVVARAALLLLDNDPDKAAVLAEAAQVIPGVSPRAQYLLGRALLGGGRVEPGLAALRAYLVRDPADPRAQKLVATRGAEPKLQSAPASDPSLTFTATSDSVGVESAPFNLHARWPLSWRVAVASVEPEAGVVVNLETARVVLGDGDTDRGTAVVLAQRPETPVARAAMVKKGGRNIFPDAKLKTLAPLVPGSRREQFREKAGAAVRLGEVTTFERGEVVYFLVLNATAEAYPKLKDDYAALVKSVKDVPPALRGEPRSAPREPPGTRREPNPDL